MLQTNESVGNEKSLKNFEIFMPEIFMLGCRGDDKLGLGVWRTGVWCL